jgi:hypothetical protein
LAIQNITNFNVSFLSSLINNYERSLRNVWHSNISAQKIFDHYANNAYQLFEEAKKDFFHLDYLFSKTLVQSSILSFAGVVVFVLFIVLSRRYDIVVGDIYIGNRFLPYLPLVFMCLTVLFNHISGSWALYLRCHKREPLLLQSSTLGFLCSASALILGRNYGVVGLTSGYLVLTVVSFGWIFLTWRVKRKEWHLE